MIVSFRSKETREFHAGKRIKRFESIKHAAQIKLDRLHIAESLVELACLPGNRLEALKGDRTGRYSIRINDQWRVCFTWNEADARPADVELVDYH